MFIAQTMKTGSELWLCAQGSDHCNSVTFVKDIIPGPEASNSRAMDGNGSTELFFATTSGLGREILECDRHKSR